MRCSEVQEKLALYSEPQAEIEAHLQSCEDCREVLAEYQLISSLLKERKARMPEDFIEKAFAALDAEPAPKQKAKFHWFSLPSVGIGAAVAAGLVLALRFTMPMPSIQTAAVTPGQNVDVQIGFNVTQDVKDVTFQIDLPKGLKFVDADGQPIESRTVAWKGELKTGKTVVPVTVRGVQPGKWEILATVRKNQMAQQTKIVLPVNNHS